MEEFKVTINGTIPFMRSASFGADRNERGGKLLRFPIALRHEAGLTAPKASVTPAGSVIRLPEDWGIWQFAKRDLRCRVVEAHGGARILDSGPNFVIAAGPKGSGMTVVYEWYEKNGKWSRTIRGGWRIVFAPRPAPNKWEDTLWVMSEYEPLSDADLASFWEDAEEVTW